MYWIFISRLQRETKAETMQLWKCRYARFAIKQPSLGAPQHFRGRLCPSGAANPPGMCALKSQIVSGLWLHLLETAHSKTRGKNCCCLSTVLIVLFILNGGWTLVCGGESWLSFLQSGKSTVVGGGKCAPQVLMSLVNVVKLSITN